RRCGRVARRVIGRSPRPLEARPGIVAVNGFAIKSSANAGCRDCGNRPRPLPFRFRADFPFRLCYGPASCVRTASELAEAKQMTRKNSWRLFSILGLVLAVGAIWAQSKKEQTIQSTKTAQCCGEEDSCPACCKSCPNCKNHKTAKEQEIMHRLGTKISSLSYKEAPLRKILDDLGGWSGINIVPDSLALNEAGVSLDRPVTFKLEGVALKSAL